MKKKAWIVIAALLLGCVAAVPQGKTMTVLAAQTTENTAAQKSQTAMAVSGISKDRGGRLYMADRTYHVLRRRNQSGNYVVLAGQLGKSGYKDGSAAKALFNSPWDTVSYKKGWAISDTENHVIRVMDKNGKVTVYAGSKEGCRDGKAKSARFCEPTGLYYYKGALYVADSGNHRICKIENGQVKTVAGSRKGIEGDSVGSALSARFSNPQEILMYKGVMYISDTGNGSVKKLGKGKVTELVKAYSLNDLRAPAEPCGLMIKGGYLFVGDMFTEELLRIKL